MYLKNDMKAKFKFLHDLEAAVGFTSSMLVQEFVGSTTIVPQVSFVDYFRVSIIQPWFCFFVEGFVLIFQLALFGSKNRRVVSLLSGRGRGCL